MKQTAKNKKEEVDLINEQTPTKFRIWCMKKGLTQRQIKKDTNLAIGTIHAMWYKGNANSSSIKLLSLVYKIDEQKLSNMIHEFDKSNPED